MKAEGFRVGPLTLLSASPLGLLSHPIPDQSELWLELLHGFVTVVDQCEPGALSTAILCSKAKDGDLISVGFVELG